MKIEFVSVSLLNYYIGTYSGKQKFPEDILKRFRDKVNFMIGVESIMELSKLKSLNIEKYKDHWSARINIQYRIEFDFIKPNTLVILKISKHYEN